MNERQTDATDAYIAKLERENAELKNILTRVMVKGWSKKGMWERAEALVAKRGRGK